MKQLNEDIKREDNAPDGEKEDNANGDDLLEEHRSLQLQNQWNIDLYFSSLFFPNLSLFPTIVNMFNENYFKIFWSWVNFLGCNCILTIQLSHKTDAFVIYK